MYPAHLYDKTRRTIAIQLLDKEIRKQLLHDPSDSQIDVEAWMNSLDDQTFWNAVEGFMGGALLKPIVHFLTAENYAWSERDIKVADIQLSSKLQQLERLEGLAADDLRITKIKSLLDADQAECGRQKVLIEENRKSTEQNSYPIIVVEKDGRPMVMDGNRRSLEAFFDGKETIRAWYCQTDDELPRNYWYPIDDMMRLTKLYVSSKDTNPALKAHLQAVLYELFMQSSVAEVAYRERLVKVGTHGAQELLDGIAHTRG